MKFRHALIVSLFLMFPYESIASPYDDCILQNMHGTQNKEAVYAIERACISKTSVTIPKDKFTILHATASIGAYNNGYVDEQPKLLVEFDNNTGFDITELVISVKDNKTGNTETFTIHNFPDIMLGGGLLMALPEPEMERLRNSQPARFLVTLGNKFAQTKDFGWLILSAKGIPVS